MLRASTLASKALVAIGEATSISDPKRRLRLLNEVRQFIHAQQRQLGIDLSLSICVRVDNYNGICSGVGRHRGFRLPQHVITAELAAINNRHIPIENQWRLPYDGMSGSPCNPELRLIDRGFMPTQWDYNCATWPTLRVQSEGCEPQTMVLTGVTVEDREEKVIFKVTREPTLGETRFKSITSIVFPDGVDVGVLLWTEDMKLLARYEHGTTIGRFRAFELVNGDCLCPESVVVKATQGYHDITDECDIVEFEHLLAWKWLAKFITAMHSDDANDSIKAKEWLALAIDMLVQSAATTQGDATQTVFRRKPMGGQAFLNSDRNCRSTFTRGYRPSV